MHLGTGCDYLNKIGTKHAALNANPENYLSNFCKGLELSVDEISKAEE